MGVEAQFCPCFRLIELEAAEFQSKINAPGFILSCSSADGPTRLVLNS